MLLIDSTPPARIISASSFKILIAAETKASMPEAQFLCTVKAGIFSGNPAFKAITRAILAASAGCATLPIITSSIVLMSTPERIATSLTILAPKSCAVKFFITPPALPIGDLKPAITAILSFIL